MIPVLLGMLLYGYIHSFIARRGTKVWVQQRIGERAFHGLYRLGFNVMAVLTIFPILLLTALYPGENVWKLSSNWTPLLLIVQAIGLIGLVVSLLQIDLGRFLGLSQLLAYLNDRPLPLPAENLQVNGLYRIVRHPLYVFSILMIWPVTTMPEAYFGFCVGATIYFLVGSLYEEKRLVEAFGREYIDYQHRVSWMLPLPRLRQRRTPAE